MSRPNRPRLVVVSPYGPGRRDAGERVRLGALLDELSDHFEVQLITWGLEAVQDDERWQQVPVPRRLRRQHRIAKAEYIASFLLRVPAQWLAVRRRHRLRQWIKRELTQRRPDWVLASQLSGAAAVPNSLWSRTMVDTHNAEGPRWVRIAALQTNPLARLLARAQARSSRRIERRVGREVWRVIAVSAQDREYFHGLGCRTTLVRNGYWPPSTKRLYDDVRPSVVKLLFVGSLSYSANLDALTWLAEIAGEVQGQARFTIVGSGDSTHAQRLFQGSTNVDVLGQVADLSQVYCGHDALVVPLRMGGGSRLKILESVAHGLLVISSSVGAEGTGLIPEREYLEADTTAEWVRRIAELRSHYTELTKHLPERASTRLDRQDWPAAIHVLASMLLDSSPGAT